MTPMIYGGIIVGCLLFVAALALFSNGLGKLPADDDPADEVRPDKPCEIEPYEHLDQDWETRRD